VAFFAGAFFAGAFLAVAFFAVAFFADAFLATAEVAGLVFAAFSVGFLAISEEVLYSIIGKTLIAIYRSY
jgi:hypothetical protein